MSESVVPARPAAGGPGPVEILVVRNLEDLRAISESRLLYSKRPLAVSLPGRSAEEAEAITARLNAYRTECGCSLGAKCMTAGFVAALAWLAAWNGVFTSAFLWRLPLALLFTLACAGAGKAVGITSARRRLRRELNLLLVNAHNHT